MLFGERVPRRYRVMDPRTGEIPRHGVRASTDESIPDTGEGPRVYVCCDTQ